MPIASDCNWCIEGRAVDAGDDGAWSEITILPDGRMYVFGLTDPLLDVLAALPTREGVWQELHEQVRHTTGQEIIRE
jgi:hypothetical protein